jgi:hypothetical protein
MRPVWVGIYPERNHTRILVTAGPGETLLKARLAPTANHPRALAALLEALALWQGQPVRAVLAVDARAGSSDTSLCRRWFAADDETPLYRLDVVYVQPRRRRRNGLDGVGDFRDLAALLLREVGR